MLGVAKLHSILARYSQKLFQLSFSFYAPKQRSSRQYLVDYISSAKDIAVLVVVVSHIHNLRRCIFWSANALGHLNPELSRNAKISQFYCFVFGQ